MTIPASSGMGERDAALPSSAVDQTQPSSGEGAVVTAQAGTVVSSRRAVPRWCGWLLVALGLLTLPWIAAIAAFLPSTSQDAHYDVSWAGFDVLLCALLLRTGWTALKGREQSELTAAMTGTLLLVDAWFDTLSASHTLEFVTALAMAVFVELPLAGLCLWIVARVDAERARRERFMSAALRRLSAYGARRHSSARRP
jgi:hypothetical protein